VVVASEIWPSLSRQSSAQQWLNSRIRNNGFLLGERCATPVSGIYQLNSAATAYSPMMTEIAARGGVLIPVSIAGMSIAGGAPESGPRVGNAPTTTRARM